MPSQEGFFYASLMKLIVEPTLRIEGQVTPPSSKSHSVRALLLATLANGTSTLKNILDASDTRAAIDVCRKLGAKITCVKNINGGLDCTVESNGTPLQTNETELFSSNSGITTTFIIAILGLRKETKRTITLSCGKQMMQRPIDTILNAVMKLGLEIEDTNGHCPLKISGKINGGEVEIDGTNSQNVSALLLALPLAPNTSIINVKNLQERPYVKMTLRCLDEQNIEYTHTRSENIDQFVIPGNQVYKPFEKTISGDFSSASYIIAAAVLLPGHVKIHNMDMADSQGDKRIIQILQEMGAHIEIQEKTITIEGGHPLTGQEIDCSDIPDMVPTLAVIATQAEGKTTLTNIGHARIKETDRLKSMTTELKKMGAKIEEHATSLVIYHSRLFCASLDGYNDHRTIMALAIASLLPTDGTSEITTAERMDKTFPNFTTTMNTLGTKMRTSTPKHLILIGFKNAGKTTIGQELAKRLGLPFIDLDEEIITHHEKISGKKQSCREIIHEYGETFFRNMEHIVLGKITTSPVVSVIALGGGTPTVEENHPLLMAQHIIHIAAQKSIVFERIMINGKPAFFPEDQDAFISFQKLWNEREPIFNKLATMTIQNNGSIKESVENILRQLVTKTTI